MVGVILIVVGAALMILGAAMLAAWAGGKSTWFDPEIYDRQGNTVNDRQFLNLYFLATVLAPLLGGGILIVFGLLRLV